MSTRGHDLEDLLGQIQALADRDDRVRLRDLHDLIGVRAFGPLLLMMALVALTPIGAVPALPTALAIAVTLIAGQVVLGRNRLWLPDFVERRHVSSKKLKASVRALSRPDALAGRGRAPPARTSHRAAFRSWSRSGLRRHRPDDPAPRIRAFRGGGASSGARSHGLGADGAGRAGRDPRRLRRFRRRRRGSVLGSLNQKATAPSLVRLER